MRLSPFLGVRPACCRSRRNFMTDLIMLALGAGAFVLFIGYVALCERL